MLPTGIMKYVITNP